jgi:hypothetical protein
MMRDTAFSDRGLMLHLKGPGRLENGKHRHEKGHAAGCDDLGNAPEQTPGLLVNGLIDDAVLDNSSDVEHGQGLGAYQEDGCVREGTARTNPVPVPRE